MNKSQKLAKIAQDIEKCRDCKEGKVGVAVVGEGNSNAEIMFIGEAPGRNEAVTGRPFIGRSGKFLRKAIIEAGLTEEEAYITSPVKYLPEYVTPTEKDIEHGMTHLSKQIDVIDPQILVLLGSVACRGVLGEKVSVSKIHGQTIQKGGKTYFISYHPSAAIRFTKIRDIFLKDFASLRHKILRNS